jgi:hypothetical protein
VARGDQRIACIVPFAEIKDGVRRFWKKLADHLRDARARLIHELRRAHTARERGFFRLAHLLAGDDHEERTGVG